MLENHYLDDLFHPKGIAVIGASNREQSVGYKVLSNLIKSKFPGGLFPVNPKHANILDKTCYPSIEKVREEVDLAVITTPARFIPQIIDDCGKQGIKSAVIISAGFSEIGPEGKALEQAVLETAEKHNLHFIGPNCLGIIRPEANLNATFDDNYAMPGNIALVSQSGAICAAILDWAQDQEIGFSSIISIGNSADFDFGELLEYLSMDPTTKSILLYIEGIHKPRRFMSGLRAAARIKPVIVIKAGRHTTGIRAAHSHTGALVGDDDVFSAALDRCGAIRVMSIEQLFTAAEVLAKPYHSQGNNLTIITNGGGAGVMASDVATDLNIELPELSKKTMTDLDTILPPQWSHHNPIDILGDATPKRYHDVVATCLQDENNDALLTILVPVAMSQPHEVAKEICSFAKESPKPLITCWMGGDKSKSSKKLFAAHQIPCYSTPELAVLAFSYLANYHFNQQLLLESPSPLLCSKESDIDGAELIINAALAENRLILSMTESKAILHAMGIPVSQTINAHTANEALIAAESLGYPVVMKIASPDITHKQDVNGVKLNIQNGKEVRPAFNAMIAKVKANKPEATISGVTIEPMYKGSNYREVMVGMVRDKVFGPIISFGMGGSLVEVIKDRAIGLPPLNHFLVRQMIAKTKAKQILAAFRGKPAVNTDALIDVLIRISDLVSELPQLQELDINPLLIDEQGAVVIDARIVVSHSPLARGDYSHMAIHPYPRRLISQWQTPKGIPITLRPIRPEDAMAEQEFVRNLSSEAKYFRFMHEVKELTPETLVRFTQIDYQTEFAFVATVNKDNKETIIGVSRYYTQADRNSCEFALVVADNWQKQGIGSRLMQALIAAAKAQRIKTMSGQILAENVNMLGLAESLGFTICHTDDATIKLAVKHLFD